MHDTVKIGVKIYMIMRLRCSYEGGRNVVGKNRKANLKIYIIPFIIITLIFATITVTMSRSIKTITMS